jgi:hypothetical protein
MVWYDPNNPQRVTARSRGNGVALTLGSGAIIALA